MYTLCITEKTAMQQQQFEQAFLQMALEMEYDCITVSDLCRRAGLSRKIFYRLFERKADVLYALLDHTLIKSTTYVPDESVGPGELHRFFAFWRTQGDLLEALVRLHNSHILTDRVIRHVLNEESGTVHTFGADVGKYGLETMSFYLTGIMTLVLTWHKQDYNHSIDEMSELLMHLLSTPPIKHPNEA